MLRKFFLAAAAALALATGTATANAAELGVVTVRPVNLRAGPGVDYPVVAGLPARAHLVLHGCLAGYTWCDVTWHDQRGWLAAGYMNAIYRDAPVALTAAAAARIGVRIVLFDAGYWRRFYYGRPWFRAWRYHPLWR